MINNMEDQSLVSKTNLRSFINNEEEERKKLSYALQNSVNHLLFSAKLNVYLIENKIIKNKDTVRLKKILDNAIEEIINISYLLYPVILDELGLVGALNNLLKDFRKKTDIIFQFDHLDIPKQISFFIKTNIFRIVQELINEIAKKENVSKINISVSRKESQIILDLKSYGKNYTPENAFSDKKNKSKSELLNVKERVELLNGELDIIPLKTGGIEIIVKIPFDVINKLK